jgi:hypothetical protein
MLTPADLEWIRRLPDQPEKRDLTTLKALKRKAAANSSEVRLLDSILREAPRDDARQRERQELERRLAVIDNALSDDGQERSQQARTVGARRIARVKVQRRELSLADAQNEAARRIDAQAEERRATAQTERKAVRTRLRELKRLGV